VALSPTFREPFPGGGAVPPTVAGDAAGPAGLADGVPAGETAAPEGTRPFDRLRADRSGGPGGKAGAGTAAPEGTPPSDRPKAGRSGGPDGEAGAGTAAPSGGATVPGTASAPPAGASGGASRGGAAAGDDYQPDRRVVRVTERPATELAAAGAAPVSSDTARSATARPSRLEPAALDTSEREQALRRLAELRREQRQLDRRLTALAALVAPEAAPALLLGGDESVELVLDLTAAAPTADGVRPASYRPGGPPGRL
jgi:hypothetical protein